MSRPGVQEHYDETQEALDAMVEYCEELEAAVLDAFESLGRDDPDTAWGILRVYVPGADEVGAEEEEAAEAVRGECPGEEEPC